MKGDFGVGEKKKFGQLGRSWKRGESYPDGEEWKRRKRRHP